MLIPGNLTASILVTAYFVIYLMAIPLSIGLFSRTARRATMFSAFGGLLGAMGILGLAVFLRGVRGLPPLPTAFFLFGASSIAASVVGWLTYRFAGFFREETPVAATRKTLQFLFMLTAKAALFYVVLNAIGIVSTVDFADEIPQLMLSRLEPIHYLYVGAAIVIVFTWIFATTRRGRNLNPVWLAVVQIIPLPVFLLLFLPMLMGQLQTTESTALLDCSSKGIPGYFPDMIDYTRFVLDALGAGALLGLRSTIGWKLTTCAPLAASPFASCLAFSLNLAPVLLLALLALRIYRLRAARYAAIQTP